METKHQALQVETKSAVPLPRLREVAARHHLDTRTLRRALDEGPEKIRGMAGARCEAAVAELSTHDT